MTAAELHRRGPRQTVPVLELDLRGFARDQTPVLGPISLTVQPAETVALLGPSGIGKTTLLRIICGLESTFEGTSTARGVISMIFQEPTLLPWRTLRDNLCITTGVSPAEATTALDEVGLASLANQFPGQLSLGQQRRLAVARAFALKPDLLLMDEPFVSLDPALVDEMMSLFETLRAAHRVASILVTHARSEADRLADRILTLGGTPAQITGSETL